MTTLHPVAPPALVSVQTELRRYLLALALVLNDIYGEHAASAVLGGRRAGDGRGGPTDVSHITLYAQLHLLWDYAFNGRLTTATAELAFARPSCFALLDALLRMLEHNSQLPTLWASVEPHGDDFTPGGVRYMVDVGLARVALDSGADLTLPMLAALSGDSVMTVEQQLQVEQSAIVPAAQGRRWLADCEHFVVTTRINESCEELPGQLHSQRELRRFLRARIALQFDGDFQRFFHQVEMPDDDIEAKIDGNEAIQLCDALPLARALQLESRWLLTQILRINHPHEAGLLLPR